MRPIDKGNSPYREISKYQEAEPYLEQKIGAYCSFCEMRVNNALAVEHKESKNSGGERTKWENLLLSCTYCNSRKMEKVKKGEAHKWIWPDEHNTFLAFTYENALPKVNEEYLKAVGTDILGRARTTFEGLVLDYCPGADKIGEKKRCADKRWQRRFETLGIAEEARTVWMICKNSDTGFSQLRNIVNLARGYGFFSVWMMVFSNEVEVRKALIEAFPGTAEDCFDEHGVPKIRKVNEL